MPDFGSNPDIDEKPPIPLRECLEKVKPFIVALEGIKDQEEWEVKQWSAWFFMHPRSTFVSFDHLIFSSSFFFFFFCSGSNR